MISEQQIQEMKSRMPEVLQYYGIHNPRRQFRSPWRSEDHTPSCTYYPSTNLICDYGDMDEDGNKLTLDVFGLVGKMEGFDGFLERARMVADIVGIRLDETAPSTWRPKKKRANREVSLYPQPAAAGGADIADVARKAFEDLYDSEDGWIAQSYLHYRGLSDEDFVRCGLGFTKKPSEIMPEFNAYEDGAFGFVVIPYWNQDYSKANYAMLRTVSKAKIRNKEWRPKGLTSPLYREWMLSAGLDSVVVAEGLIDCISLEKMVDRPVMALGGIGMAKRLASVIYHTPKALRPKTIVIAMDNDEAGVNTAAQITRDLDAIGVKHCMMPTYPNGAKDANEWLTAREGVDWSFEELPSYEGDECPFLVTSWKGEK